MVKCLLLILAFSCRPIEVCVPVSRSQLLSLTTTIVTWKLALSKTGLVNKLREFLCFVVFFCCVHTRFRYLGSSFLVILDKDFRDQVDSVRSGPTFLASRSVEHNSSTTLPS